MIEQIDEILNSEDINLTAFQQKKDSLNATIEKLSSEGKFSSPEYASSLKEVNKLDTIIAHINKLTKLKEDYLGLSDMKNDPDMAEMVKEEEDRIKSDTEESIKIIKPLTLKPTKDDEKKAIFEIRPGVGGVEASIFAGNLFEMYTKYLKNQGIAVELYFLDYDQDGIKEAAFLADQEDSFGLTRFEGGVHRVQRVPKTESGGRIHTSTASVVIIPESSTHDFQINQNDLRIDVYRASGPGGQSVNTTDSAVRITHIPTGLVVTCQNGKSQHKNKEMAMSILVSKLKQIEDAKAQKMENEMREKLIKGGDRSAKIRTYNFPQSRVTDHRIGKSWFNIAEIMQGDLEDIVSSTSEVLRKDPNKIVASEED